MADHISGQIFKKKALDRWENEGGRVFPDRTGRVKSGLSNERTGKDNAAQIFENSAADKLKVRKIKEVVYE